jgi:uroporphyrinogen decarboxylase
MYYMNKVERINAALANKPVDRVPVVMWYHFDPALSVERAVDAHYKFSTSVDQDIIKIMYDNDYFLDEAVKKPTDWRGIRPRGKDSPFYRKQRDILRGLLEKSKGEFPIWVTMFGAFKFAVMAVGNDMVMRHAKEDPASFKAGVAAIADSLCEWAEGYLSEGANAIFYSAQFGEPGRFTKSEWSDLVSPFDLQGLDVAEKMSGKYNILHLCGEPEYGYRVHIDRFGGYPSSGINWAAHPHYYEIERGRDFFDRPILGGLDNHGVMSRGSADEVKKATAELLERNGKLGYILGADCSIESPDFEWRIKAAVDAAKEYAK